MTAQVDRIIKAAAQAAYDEDAIQIIGRIQGEWAFAHIENVGRQAEMVGGTWEVASDGLVQYGQPAPK